MYMFHGETAKEITSCFYFFLKMNERTDNDLLRSEVLRSYDQTWPIRDVRDTWNVLHTNWVKFCIAQSLGRAPRKTRQQNDQ